MALSDAGARPEYHVWGEGGLSPFFFPPLFSPFPSLPLFLSLFPFLPSPFSLLSLPLPLEVGALFAARGSGRALKLSQRVRAEPGR